MATTESTLESTNFLQPTGFKIIVNRKRFKNLEFFAQSAVHPDLSASPALLPFRGANAFVPGDKIEYGQFSVDAILDENMNVYKEMHQWIKGTIGDKFVPSGEVTAANEDATSYDVSLLVLSSHNNVIDTIRYKDAFPVSLGSINFQATADAVQYITFPVTFAYTTFTISD